MDTINLEWNSEFNIGNIQIDKEHQNLFLLARKALTIEKLNFQDNKKEELKKIIIELTTYVKSHFINEKEYMEKVKYPDLKNHIELHDNMFKMLSNLIKELNSLSTDEIQKKLSDFIYEYFVKHIITEDKRIQLWCVPLDELKKTFGWKSIYSVGNIHIDKEHKQLFDIANEAFKEVNEKNRKDKIKTIILRLYDYMNKHFEHEEEFMENINYPKIDEHKEMHKNLISLVQNFIKQLSVMNLQIFEKELAKIIDILLVKHIIKEDRKIIIWHNSKAK